MGPRWPLPPALQQQEEQLVEFLSVLVPAQGGEMRGARSGCLQHSSTGQDPQGLWHRVVKALPACSR